MSGKIALNLILDRKGSDTLEELRVMLGHDTKAKTINTGLTLLKWAATQIQSGGDIGSVNPKSDELSILHMDFITHLRGKVN